MISEVCTVERAYRNGGDQKVWHVVSVHLTETGAREAVKRLAREDTFPGDTKRDVASVWRLGRMALRP